jgi:diphthine synthase
MLYLIGIGLADKKDITVKGLEAVKTCDTIYLEHYTSVLPDSTVEELEAFYGKNITLASRDFVESADELLAAAQKETVALLVVGDVFGATTHTDLLLRSKELGIETKIINNASIMNAIGNIGLELYKFGKTTSMVFFDGDWKPRTPYQVLNENKALGLHTLVLLDIKTAEPTKESLLKGRNDIQPPRFMTVNEGLTQFLELEATEGENVLDDETLVVGVARIGCKDEIVKAGTIKELLMFDFGAPLHCVIFPSTLHHIEEEALDKLWK